MSQENVDVVRRLWDAADRRDTETALALYDPDVELDVSGFPIEATEGHHYRGHDGLRRLFREWREFWEQAESTLVELVDAGDRVVGVYTYRARGRASGIPVESTFAALWTVNRGRVIRVEWCGSRDMALEAVGLSEPPPKNA
jgi:ketosteroid isomerase-like protein